MNTRNGFLAMLIVCGAVAVAHARPGGGCTPVVGAHCFDDVGCGFLGPTYMTTLMLVCGDVHSDPNPLLGSIVEFIDVPGGVDLAEVALFLGPDWEALLRATSTIIPSSVPDSPSIPNIVFRYRGAGPLVAPQVLGPFPFRTPASVPPLSSLRYATRTFVSGTALTQGDTIQFVPLPGAVNNVTFRPLGGVRLSTAAVGGGTAVVLDGIGGTGADGARLGGCGAQDAPGRWRGRVIPWMLDGPASGNAYVQVSVDATGPQGTHVPDALQLTLGAVGPDHVVHVGTGLRPVQITSYNLEVLDQGKTVQTFFVEPCEIFGGFVPQNVCDFFISGYCYFNPSDQGCFCFENPGACDGLDVGGTFGTLSGSPLVQCRLRLARPLVIRRGSGAPVTGDEIVVSMRVRPGELERIDSWRVRASSVGRLAVLDAGFIPDACPADFNADGALNSQDFFDYLAAFFAHDLSADFNNDSAINSQDFFDFLGAFFAGC